MIFSEQIMKDWYQVGENTIIKDIEYMKLVNFLFDGDDISTIKNYRVKDRMDEGLELIIQKSNTLMPCKKILIYQDKRIISFVKLSNSCTPVGHTRIRHSEEMKKILNKYHFTI